MTDLQTLTEEYQAWCKANGLEWIDAQEHLADETTTEAQRAWLKNFSARWEKAEQAND